MLAVPVAAVKVFAVKAGTSIDQARLPFQPACLFSLPAFSVCLPCFVPTTRALTLV